MFRLLSKIKKLGAIKEGLLLELGYFLTPKQLFRLIQSIPSPKIAKQGGNVAKVAKLELEAKTGKKVVISLNASAALEGNKTKNWTQNKRNNGNYTKFNTTITVSPAGHYFTHS
ncbi:MAG: hypothetical protein K8R67_03095 [Desulfobacteraceae bacterium]|nr:hypothetical protein [Desulfobacteraceae bacterium]